MENPLVTVICLCYNHAQFVAEALESVFLQTHPAVQLVVVDDSSTDDSVAIIRKVLETKPEVTFLALGRNHGNCRAFNKGFAYAKGEYIIDLAADDVLHPDRIETGIRALESAGKNYGVNFSDATLINADGDQLGLHSDRFPHGTIPQGDIYKDVIARYFINSPTMMMRRQVFETLGGYDETLAYEDFDFWIRSSRKHLYCYTPFALISRRVLANSMTTLQYKRNSPQLFSTFKVCQKICKLNVSSAENKALRKRIFYEMRKALAVGELRLTWRYFCLYFSVG